MPSDRPLPGKWAGHEPEFPPSIWEITSAEFEAGQYGCSLRLVSKDHDLDGNLNNPERQAWYSAGQAMRPIDNGQHCVYENPDGSKDPERGFSSQSAIHELLMKAIDAGAPWDLDTLDPTDASIWVGLKFRMEPETRTNRMDPTKTRTVRWPVEYLGKGSSGGRSQAASGNGAVDAALLDRIRAHKKKAEVFLDFYDLATSDPGIVGPGKLDRKDPLLRESGPRSIWAEADA